MEKLRALASPAMFRCLPSSHAFWKLALTFLLLLTLLNLTRQLLSLTRTHDALPATRRPVVLPDSRTFRIAVFSDLHFGEEEGTWGPEQDRKTLGLMREVLAAETPDLVVLNGDLVTGENTARENATKYVDMLVQPMIEADVPWASTYGNHDSQFNLSREAIFEAEAKYDLCQTWRADETLPGITNYYLPIATGTGSGRPSAILWFFDSRGGKPYQEEGEDIPGWVAPKTASWFLNTHTHLTREHSRVLPSMAFVHIPTSSYLPVQGLVQPALFPGQNHDDPLAAQSDGTSPSHPATAFADALYSAEGLHSVHAGHDHGNDWCMPGGNTVGERPFLCFGRHTGHGGYGKWVRGARILELAFYGFGEGKWGPGMGMEVETWVRLEGGDVVGRVGLNDTFGGNRYPADG